MAEEDTFFAVKDQILKALKKAKKLYLTISDLTEKAVPAQQEHLEWATSDFQESLQSAEIDLEDLKEALHLAENDHENYSVDPKEIKKRKEFIKQVSEIVASLKEGTFDANKIGLPEYEVISWPSMETYKKLLSGVEHLDGTDERKFAPVERLGISDPEIWKKDNSNQYVVSRASLANPTLSVNQKSKAVWCFIPEDGPPFMYCSGKPWCKQVKVFRNKKFIPFVFRTPIKIE